MNIITWAGVALIAASFAHALPAAAQDRPVTPPDSYRVVMENDRVRMIEIHVKPRSKVDVDSPAGRDRFLYMLSDGALILAPPGKTPYEFALQAGETAVFPPVSPTVENDTDVAVRALMVEVKGPVRSASASTGKGKRHSAKSRGKGSKVAKASSRSKAKSKQAVKPRKPRAATAVTTRNVSAPLNLRQAAKKRVRN